MDNLNLGALKQGQFGLNSKVNTQSATTREGAANLGGAIGATMSTNLIGNNNSMRSSNVSSY